MVLRIDIDNTICDTQGVNYWAAKPKLDIIHKINKLYNEGHTIVIWTSRGVGSGKDLNRMTRGQLKQWGVKYHSLKMDKPLFDLFVDDKAINAEDFINANTL
jgi:hypothetical protein